MSKNLVMILFSVCMAAASYRLNQSLVEAFSVEKFRTNYQPGWSVQEMEDVSAVNNPNMKKLKVSLIIVSNNIK